jgi:hypothetical protein
VSSSRPSLLLLAAVLPFFFTACGVSFQPRGEVRFDGSEVLTAMNASDLDANGKADLVVGVSTFSPAGDGAASPLFSTLFLFEESGKSWKYLWKSYPLNRNDRKMETVADEVETISLPPDTNDRRLLIRTGTESLQLGFASGRYVLEPCRDPYDPPVTDRDLSEYFRFRFDAPFFFVKGGRQYLFLKRNDAAIELYRFRPEADPPFRRVGRLPTGPVTAYCVFRDPSAGGVLLCVGGADHRLSFFRVRGL